MVHFTLQFVGTTVLACFAVAAPSRLSKRIAQVISDSTQPWVQACTVAGGGQQCNPISVTAFTTLLAAAGPCDQQDSADAMIDLAKSLNSDAKMIQLAQIFAQQPRNSPTSLSVPYCQVAPKNQELNGLFQCQFSGVNPTEFVGNVAVGGAGTIPIGHSSPISPPGSCPANPQGGIADGTQLVALTQNPGVTGSSTGGKSKSSSTSAAASAPSPTATDSDDDDSDCDGDSSETSSSPEPSETASSTSSAGNFQQQNGKDAQALNKAFAALTPDSDCQPGQNACIDGQFAQCVSGKFVLTSCGTDLICVVLPLVNSKGTSTTCDTVTDAKARITASGVSGGITG